MIVGAVLGIAILRLTVRELVRHRLRRQRTAPDFRYGLVSAMTWSNFGGLPGRAGRSLTELDLPLAVLGSLTLSAPFGGQADSDLAIAIGAWQSSALR